MCHGMSLGDFDQILNFESAGGYEMNHCQFRENSRKEPALAGHQVEVNVSTRRQCRAPAVQPPATDFVKIRRMGIRERHLA